MNLPEVASAVEDAPLTLTVRTAGQTALYLYSGEPTTVHSKPYAEMLMALDDASRGGDPVAIQSLVGPDGEGIRGMRAEFAANGVELGRLRTLPQVFSLAVGAGHLQIHRTSYRPKYLFTNEQLRILDYAAVGFTNGEIPELLEMTGEDYQTQLNLMAEQAGCEPGLLRIMRKAFERQSRVMAFGLEPHPPVSISRFMFQDIVDRANGKDNPQIAREHNRSQAYQRQRISRVLKNLDARRVTEAITKLVAAGTLDVEKLEPEGLPPTDRQLEALTLAALGHKNAKVAEEMGINPHEADKLLSQAATKLGAEDAENAVLRAFGIGIFVVDPVQSGKMVLVSQ